MRSLFEPDTYHAVLQRLDTLQPDATRQWGKMSAAQMLEHTARAVEMALGRRGRGQIWLGRLLGWMFWREFAGETPFRRNGPTGPDFIIHDEPDFAAAKARLRALVTELHAAGAAGCDGHVHGFFGRMSGEDWGRTQFKHVDHHLRQFGC